MNIKIQLDDTFEQKAKSRLEELQSKRVRELREAGEAELAAKVSESDPDAATYVKNLIREDLN